MTTRREIIIQAIAGKMSWIQAADILGMTDRHLRRCRAKFDEFGVDGLVDRRGGSSRRKRVSVSTIEKVCALKQTMYADFSIKHFHEKIIEKHGLKLSYTLTRMVLQDAGIVEKQPGRGTHRRKRDRREMEGMMLHNDASTHTWIAEQPPRDLVVTMDDASSKVLHMKFVEQEGTMSTLDALHAVVSNHGRFAEFYTDRGSHFCRTPKAGAASETEGQVSRVCKTLGIRQILAHSPQARGRSERFFKTVQGRLPQELRAAGITAYGAKADRFLEAFRLDMNRRFATKPKVATSAFVRLIGVDISLICSIQHERTVSNDNTVSFENMTLQIPKSQHRNHYVRCQVIVHRMLDHTLTITYQGRPVGRFQSDGRPLVTSRRKVAI